MASPVSTTRADNIGMEINSPVVLDVAPQPLSDMNHIDWAPNVSVPLICSTGFTGNLRVQNAGSSSRSKFVRH
jgi:hypothetical protein